MKQYKVISLFTGIGGMDIGLVKSIIVHKNSIVEKEFIQEILANNFVKLRANPFKIVFQNDILESSKKVCEYNDICYNYNTSNLKNLIESNYDFPYTDVVIAGGVPCADLFSNGFQNSLYSLFFEVIRKVKPKVFVTDNVPELFTNHLSCLLDIVAMLRNLGYDVEYQFIDCADFGIPQTRKRLVIFGVSREREKKLLKKSWNILSKNKTWCSMKYYLQHLENPSKTKDKLQKLYSKKKNKLKNELVLDTNTCAPTIVPYGNRYLIRDKLDDNKRCITIRESGLLQTFPPDFVFTKNNNTKISYQQIGNAVPPLLGYLIGNKIENLLTILF